MSIELRVLGPLQVVGETGLLSLRPAQRRLLSILLLEAGGASSRDELLDRMWGEAPPPTATTSLQVHVSGLRRVLPGLVRTTPNGYLADVSRYRYDRQRFDELAVRAITAASSGDSQAALKNATAAQRLWRGQPFQDLAEATYALPEVSRLTERWLSLHELQAKALIALQRPGEAAELLSQLVQRQPLRETLWEQFMLALFLTGRRAEALAAFQSARRVLAEELGVEPGQPLHALEERILSGDPLPSELQPAPRTHNLPSATTSFVGRADDVRRLAELLHAERLVTIVGGPGFGKTRLAVEVGRTIAEGSQADVRYVTLAQTRNVLEVIGAILSATGLREHARGMNDLVRRLVDWHGVLILDNCEHLIGPSTQLVRRILASGSSLSLLLTSRAALGVEGERVWRIEPLPPPDVQEKAVDGTPAAASPAVHLFVDRARAVDRTFRLTEQTAPAIAELCRRAGGIPLALELAARWIPALGLDEVAEMLAAEPPDSATSELGHHRSLTAAMEWSMALLPPGDRRLFIRSAIFNGRFGLAAIRAVCAPDSEPRRLARAVASLADASLIAVERQPDGAALYRMLVPVREFALRRLERSREWDTLRERFVDYFLNKSYADSPDPLQQVIDLEPVDRDLDNLRQAFELGLGLGRAERVASMLVQLDGYMLNRYLVAERAFWLERALQGISDPLQRAHALRSLGSGHQVLSQPEKSLGYFRQALPLFRSSDDRHGLAQCLLSLSGLQAMRGAWADGLAAAQEARALSAELGSTSGLAVAAYYAGENLAFSGDAEVALAQLREAARLFEQAGELGRAAYALSTLTSVAVLAGQSDVAAETAPRALALAEESKSTYRLVRALGAKALLEARHGDPERARGMLIELHDLMEPYELDEVFLFLLPSAFLLRRWGSWKLLDQALHAAERAIIANGVGYPRLWRHEVERLKQERRTAAGPLADVDRSGARRTTEQTTADVRRALDPGRRRRSLSGGDS